MLQIVSPYTGILRDKTIDDNEFKHIPNDDKQNYLFRIPKLREKFGHCWLKPIYQDLTKEVPNILKPTNEITYSRNKYNLQSMFHTSHSRSHLQIC